MISLTFIAAQVVRGGCNTATAIAYKVAALLIEQAKYLSRLIFKRQMNQDVRLASLQL
jgi:hypothetical protein